MSSTTISTASGNRSRVRELLAVVDDVHAEADFVGDPREVEADVAGADDVELGRRLDRLDVDVHLSAADRARSPARSRRPARSARAAARGSVIASRAFQKRVVLVAAAADGADDPAVAEDQHLGAHALRRRAACVDDDRSRAPPARRARARRRRRRRLPGSLLAIIEAVRRAGAAGQAGSLDPPPRPARPPLAVQFA